MTSVTSFPPVADRNARVLILGSMPGVLSLKARQYYAHPRNAFWRIMGSIFGFNAELPYENRVKKLKASHVALWDVLHACVRPGSLDSAIESGSRVPNNFASFLKVHPNIRLVCFNGAEAAKTFKTYVLPQLQTEGIRFVPLPSTSPAHAVSFEQKVSAWRGALGA